jgi:hypothetical protein
MSRTSSDSDAIEDVVYGTPRDPSRPSISAGAFILTRSCTHLVRDKSDAAVLAWFSPIRWQSPCLVQFRDKGDDDSRADEPELHAGVAAAYQPSVLRGWAVLSRGTFSGSIFLTDV